MFTPRSVTSRSSTSSEAVSLAGVDVQRGSTTALRDVSFSLPRGSLSAVIGPNGAGKSSLFGVLSGRMEPSSGTVMVDGSVAEALQSTSVDPQLRLMVDDVVRMGRYRDLGLFGRVRNNDRTLIESSLEALDLLGLRGRSIDQLSGGQRQRVLVAQVLAQRGDIVLLDEATRGLDLESQQLVRNAMRSEVERGATVLFATHDLTEAARADYVIVLASECICCASPVDAWADPAVTAIIGPGPLAELQQDPPVAVDIVT